MNFKIYIDSEKEIWRIGNIAIELNVVERWVNIQTSRFNHMIWLENEQQKQKYMKEYPVFNIWECYDLQKLSVDHLIALLDYIKTPWIEMN